MNMLQEKNKKKGCDKLIVMVRDTRNKHVNLFQSIYILSVHNHSCDIPSHCMVSNRVWNG